MLHSGEIPGPVGFVALTGLMRLSRGLSDSCELLQTALLSVHVRPCPVPLAVSADDLVFDPDERGPQDESLRLHLEALDQLDPDEQAGIRALIEGALLRHQARRLAQTS